MTVKVIQMFRWREGINRYIAHTQHYASLSSKFFSTNRHPNPPALLIVGLSLPNKLYNQPMWKICIMRKARKVCQYSCWLSNYHGRAPRHSPFSPWSRPTYRQISYLFINTNYLWYTSFRLIDNHLKELRYDCLAALFLNTKSTTFI